MFREQTKNMDKCAKKMYICSQADVAQPTETYYVMINMQFKVSWNWWKTRVILHVHTIDTIYDPRSYLKCITAF